MNKVVTNIVREVYKDHVKKKPIPQSARNPIVGNVSFNRMHQYVIAPKLIFRINDGGPKKKIFSKNLNVNRGKLIQPPMKPMISVVSKVPSIKFG